MGMFARKFDDVSIIPNFVLTPLIYLGGVFYSVQMLPQFWQTVSLANPLLYVINVARYAFLGSSDVGIWVSFTVNRPFYRNFVHDMHGLAWNAATEYANSIPLFSMLTRAKDWLGNQDSNLD